jgi:hypothetical protein
MSSGTEQSATTSEAVPAPESCEKSETAGAATTQPIDDPFNNFTLNVNAAVFVPSWMPSSSPAAPSANSATTPDSPAKTPSGECACGVRFVATNTRRAPYGRSLLLVDHTSLHHSSLSFSHCPPFSTC